MRKFAVTGATGFIGRHVLAELNRYDVDVVCVARPNRLNFPYVKNGRWVHFDLSEPPADVFDRLGNADTLIHLAWQGLPNYKSLHHFESELPLQYAFLRELVRQGMESIVVVGTCFEYGLQHGPLAEHMETRPTNPYGFAKDALRKQLVHLQSKESFNLIWARLFYIYGEGQAESSLLSQLKLAVAQGLPSFDMSPGEQLRDYLPAAEVARQLVQLAFIRQDVGPINVCAGAPISVRSLVEGWIREHKWPIEPRLGRYPYPDYEPLAFWGDNGKIRALLTSFEAR